MGARRTDRAAFLRLESAVGPGHGRRTDRPPGSLDGPTVIADVVTRSASSEIVCLTGVSSEGHAIRLDLGDVNRRMVLENDVVFGSVNANRTHYEVAAEALAKADRAWLSRLITRRLPLADWPQAFSRRPHDVKVIVEFDEPS